MGFCKPGVQVVLAVVDGRRVQVQINTTRADPFLYNPLWGEPEVEVNEVEYGEAGAEDEDGEHLQEDGEVGAQVNVEHGVES